MSKYCIFVLTHKNYFLLEKCLFQLEKYTSSNIDKFILLNNPSNDVLQVANKYSKNFKNVLYLGENHAGNAINILMKEYKYDFYFKLDEDIFISTENWDKKLYLSYQNSENIGLISCLIPFNTSHWLECIRKMDLIEDFNKEFPEHYLSIKNNKLILKDHRIGFWLWKKILEKGIKTEQNLRKCFTQYSIGLIGYTRKFWENMENGFSPNDEEIINEYCYINDLNIIIDESVIAHHFSYAITFPYMMKNLFPIIKGIEF